MIKDIVHSFERNFANLPGWHTKRKIVVIESDDWGSIRMPSKETYNNFLQLGYPVDKDCYCRYDSLESDKDLTNLFEVLSSVKDLNGNSPVITANTVVANPDFEKIKESKFQTYYYELFTESLKKYPHHSHVYDLYKEGITNKLFYPQFHGREHINVNLWMDALRKQDEVTLSAFNFNSLGIPHTFGLEKNTTRMKALSFTNINEKDEKKTILADGLFNFDRLFNFKSKSFIAPSYIWHSDLNPFLAEQGVFYIQGIPYQYEPDLTSRSGYSKIYHYCGQRNKFSQIYLIRNSHFEPSNSEAIDWVDECLHRIAIAFKWHKPAIISSHRVNFIGSIDQSNSDRNLRLLKIILSAILKKWPDVEFLNSEQLGDLIKGFQS